MFKCKGIVTVFLVFFSSFFFSTQLSAQTTQWNGSQSSDWFNPGNWNNGVPGPNHTAVIGWFSLSNHEPVIGANTRFYKLDIRNTRAVLVTVAQGAEVEIDVLVVQPSSTPSLIALNVGDGFVTVNDVTTLSGGLLVGGGEITFLNDLNIASNGFFNVQTGTVNIGSAGPPLISADFSVAANSIFNLNDGTLNIFGSSVFNNSGTFNAGNGEIFFDGDITLRGNANFNPDNSTVNITGNSTITVLNNIDGYTIYFNNLIIDDGAEVFSYANVVVNNDLYVDENGSFFIDDNFNLNVIGEVTGDPHVETDRPYIISIHIINETTINVVFDEPLMQNTAELTSNYRVEDAIINGSIIGTISSATLGGVFNNEVVLVLQLNTPGGVILEDEVYYLVVNNVKNLGGSAVNSNHRKRFGIEQVVINTYFSRITGDWSDQNTWSLTGHSGSPAGQVPGPADHSIVGANHKVTLTGNITNESGSILINSTGTLVTNQYIVSGSGSFILDAGAALHIGSAQGISGAAMAGNIQTLSRIFSQQASYKYNGNSPQQTGDGLPPVVNNLSIDNLQGVTALASLRVNGHLQLDNGLFTMPPGSSLVTFQVSGSGNVRMQNIMEGGKGWRMVSAPVGPVTYAGLFDGFVSQGYAGSAYPSLQPNIIWFDEKEIGTTNMAWRTPDNASSNIAGGRGHFQYIFNGAGMPGNGGTYPDALPITMIAVGKEYMTGGIYNFGITYTARSESNITFSDIPEMNTGWNLVGNPTTATIDWASEAGWTRNNIDQTIYIWEAGANGGNGGYRAWNSLIGELEGGGLIAPFQAFWVRANNSNPLLSMTNDVKTTGGVFEQKSTSIAETKSFSNTLSVPITLKAGIMETISYITFSPGGDVGEDQYDGYRLEPMSDSWLKLYTTTARHNQPLIINNLPRDLENQIRIPLVTGGQKGSSPVNGNYDLQWSIPDDWPGHWNIVLMDHQEEEAISMRMDNSYSFYNKSVMSSLKSIPAEGHSPLPGRIVSELSDHVALKSTESNRFTIVVTTEGNESGIPVYTPDTPKIFPPYPNPVSDYLKIEFNLPEADRVRIDLIDIMGRRVATLASELFPAGHNALPEWDTKGLSTGIYIVTLTTTDYKDTARVALINR